MFFGMDANTGTTIRGNQEGKNLLNVYMVSSHVDVLQDHMIMVNQNPLRLRVLQMFQSHSILRSPQLSLYLRCRKAL